VTQLEKARARARQADEALARGEDWGPLHGLPMTVKESYDIEGLPTTRGNPLLRDNIASADAVACERLQNAGAVIFGKTNVPIFLADFQSYNEVYGTTGNPHDLSRTPGGSSGVQPLRLQQDSQGWKWAPILAARYVILRTTAVFMVTNQLGVCCQCEAMGCQALSRPPIYP